MQPRFGSGNIGSQSEQLTVAFCAVVIPTFGSAVTWTMLPPAQPMPPAVSDQQGAPPPFKAHDDTIESLKLPVPFEVWLTTVQSGSWVPTLLATVPVSQGGCSEALISSPIRCSDGAKLS